MPDSAVRDAALAPLHPVSRRHLRALTGEHGIFQHAIGSRPDPAHGYCVDDVARALQVDLLHARTLGWSVVADSAERSLRFLEDAFDPSIGRFRNFRGADGEWLETPASNDSYGRAMLALGETVALRDWLLEADPQLVERATALFAAALTATRRVTSPRAQASIVLGCAAVAASKALTSSIEPRETVLAVEAKAVVGRMGTNLHALFLDSARPGWPWPEHTLTYENALLPRALIVAGQRLNAPVMLRIGLQVLDWLIDVQTAPDGHLSPVGNGWWPMRGERSRFDQQPIEPTSLLLAAEAAYDVTGNPRYREAMERAYAWFLGANDLGLKVATPRRGASGDGLTPRGINRNEGAESTLMWLMAAEHIRALRAAEPRVLLAPVRGQVATGARPGARPGAQPALRPDAQPVSKPAPPVPAALPGVPA
jgi:hypothetical protein